MKKTIIIMMELVNINISEFLKKTTIIMILIVNINIAEFVKKTTIKMIIIFHINISEFLKQTTSLRAHVLTQALLLAIHTRMKVLSSMADERIVYRIV